MSTPQVTDGHLHRLPRELQEKIYDQAVSLRSLPVERDRDNKLAIQLIGLQIPIVSKSSYLEARRAIRRHHYVLVDYKGCEEYALSAHEPAVWRCSTTKSLIPCAIPVVGHVLIVAKEPKMCALPDALYTEFSRHHPWFQETCILTLESVKSWVTRITIRQCSEIPPTCKSVSDNICTTSLGLDAPVKLDVEVKFNGYDDVLSAALQTPVLQSERDGAERAITDALGPLDRYANTIKVHHRHQRDQENLLPQAMTVKRRQSLSPFTADLAQRCSAMLDRADRIFSVDDGALIGYQQGTPTDYLWTVEALSRLLHQFAPLHDCPLWIRPLAPILIRALVSYQAVLHAFEGNSTVIASEIPAATACSFLACSCRYLEYAGLCANLIELPPWLSLPIEHRTSLQHMQMLVHEVFTRIPDRIDFGTNLRRSILSRLKDMDRRLDKEGGSDLALTYDIQVFRHLLGDCSLWDGESSRVPFADAHTVYTSLSFLRFSTRIACRDGTIDYSGVGNNACVADFYVYE